MFLQYIHICRGRMAVPEANNLGRRRSASPDSLRTERRYFFTASAKFNGPSRVVVAEMVITPGVVPELH